MAAGNGHNGSASKGGYFADTEKNWGPGSPTKPWPDAMKNPLPPLREPVTGKPRLAVDEIFRGKHILLIGTTG
ncbi:MAG TPA: hypothetical protein VLB44_04515, partial [Kofleriaceae bacterium]|nr:hypothetical protein [Kofleriaceae bacterium]